MRALRVFRDKTGLSASPELWPSIEAALRESEHLILLASPRAAGSEWVEREIDWWLEHRSPSTLLIAVTEGDIAWGEQGDGFDPTQSSAVPVVLLDAFPAEPLWVDFRWADANARLSTDDPAFADAVADLAAPLHGRSKDEMIGEDVRQWRRTRRAVTGAVAGLALLAIAATAAAVFAFDRQREAERQRNVAVVAREAEAEQRVEAETQASLARSRQLAAEAQSLADDELDLALLLAVESYEASPTSEARAVLLDTTRAAPSLVRFLAGHEHPVRAMASETGSGSLMSVDWEGEVWVTDLQHGTSERHEVPGFDTDRAPTPRPGGDGVGFIDSDGQLRLWTIGADRSEAVGWAPVLPPDSTLGFSSDGRYIAAVSTVDPWSTYVMEIETESVSILAGPGHGPQGVSLQTFLGPARVAFSPDGRWLAVVDELGGLEVRDLTTGQLFEVGQATSIAFSPDSTAIVVASVGTEVYVLALPSMERTAIREPVDPGSTLDLQPLAFRSDGAAFLLGSSDGSVRAWAWPLDAAEPDVIGRTNGGGRVMTLAFADDTTVLVADEGGSIEQWDLERPATSGHAMSGEVARVGAVAVSPDGGLVAAGGCESPAPELPPNQYETCVGAVWIEATAGGPGTLLFPGGGEVIAAAFTPDGRMLVTGSWDTPVVATDLATGISEVISDRPAVDLAVNPVSSDVAFVGLDGSLQVTSISGTGVELRAPPDDLGAELRGGLAFSPDGKELYVALGRGTVSRWDLDTVTETTVIELGEEDLVDMMDLAVSPDGNTLAVTWSDAGGDPMIQRYEIESATESLPAITDRRFLGGMGFTPDGASLAYSSNRGLVLWDVDRHNPIGLPLEPGSAARHAVAVGGPPEAPIAVQADVNGATWWRLADDHLIEVACARANRTIEDSEWSRFATSADEPSVACT